MAALTLYPQSERLPRGERITFNLYMVSALLLFVLMMTLGLIMRMGQGLWLNVPPDLFYRILSMHGAGMVGTMSLATTAVMWFFLRKYVTLHLWAFLANYLLFLTGALIIIGAIFIGRYAGLWTFLYPLPTHPMGMWENSAAACFMVGYLFIGVGSLLFYLDAAAGIIARYGNFGRAMGLQWLFGGTIDPDHPKTVVAGTMVVIANSLGILAGAVVLVMYLVAIAYPGFTMNALYAKNLTYWFGHMYINAAIYMGVIAVYELLARYSGRPYAISRPFLWSWAASCVFVIIVFPHHLLMDYAQPRWVSVTGQVVSYLAGFPVFLVTVWGALNNIHRSGMRWTTPARLMILSLFGWAAGIVPAILDGTIGINRVMHNTQWVPGHFHFYLLLGVLPMVLALLYHVVGSRRGAAPDSAADRIGVPVYLVGGMVFALAFLDAGHMSVARRMSSHLPAWIMNDRVGAIGASLVLLAMLYFAARIIAGLLRAPSVESAANAAA
ncbi:MAG: cbb3-type cytochrome c oxidase subunit I [Dokdonella sp.]|uniref:cbb3-type cytochrome c oxidase subunit I n=1 Tax=Dokdonella sp. TaxID=2291710 RepID=UPI0025C4EECC|nr:cbb3-type cytochrome c oxidase subunit I [Dokdonella sp.]MBX3699415.1 cbb3-type cytochrome c oxidase subunit I [Dokdonella sp.]MCW5577293.1 cbb3-type cytochrome c oxidase subunit I [Dokdonella sp.]